MSVFNNINDGFYDCGESISSHCDSQDIVMLKSSVLLHDIKDNNGECDIYQKKKNAAETIVQKLHEKVFFEVAFYGFFKQKVTHNGKQSIIDGKGIKQTECW